LAVIAFAAAAFLALGSVFAHAESRIALVVGNSNYGSIPALTGPANDAQAFADLLSRANFQVSLKIDNGQRGLRSALSDFSAAIEAAGPDTVALLYFAGYAVQSEGENFLIPTDAQIRRESDLAIEAIRLTDILSVVSGPPAKARIVILDVAHGNPFMQFNQASGKGLAIIDPPAASIVALAAAPGTEGANRPFTATLITAAKTPGISIDDALKLVRVATFEASSGTQLSWESSTLTTRISLFPGPAPTPPPDLAIETSEFWQREIKSREAIDAFRFVVSQNATAGYQELLRAYPNSNYSAQIRALLERRQEMISWHDAVKANTVATFEAFLAIYPHSDLVTTAQRLLSAARVNAAIPAPPASSVRNSASTSPAAPPAVVSSPHSSSPKEAGTEATKKKARTSSDDDRPRRHHQVVRHPAESSNVPRAEPRSEPPVLLGPAGIGIGGFSIGIGH
jgi:uncharacterized caspase-like protein